MDTDTYMDTYRHTSTQFDQFGDSVKVRTTRQHKCRRPVSSMCEYDSRLFRYTVEANILDT